ncbi:hypothetical protein Huta_1316 [Halorhabdus utahensis DSM 12940]|uniref:Uncharacterized protein n=1 Tax=Halorhabdus utahensis (strain DSM 12940 / JCM 11049 / AX-2) TaxID=519442 RepID=C7NN92_HALUD|nr:hypothetical protein [Halorhabdus utahensis]ACV11492.1 hypothetical protein Huta_1316 [Halorhabdus utahensis DSM 12940]
MVSVTGLRRRFEFSRRNGLIAYYIVGLAILIVTYTVVYNTALLVLEGESQSSPPSSSSSRR